MTIKDRIIRVLKKKGLSYSDLCNALSLDEKSLDRCIEEKNIKVMEDISKSLGIPLYSFYHDPNNPPQSPGKRWYDQDIWKDDDK